MKNMACKGICTRHRAQKPTSQGRYSSGQKRCQVCEIFLTWNVNNWCPCCGYRLRTMPRNKKYKAKYSEDIKQQKQNAALMADIAVIDAHTESLTPIAPLILS